MEISKGSTKSLNDVKIEQDDCATKDRTQRIPSDTWLLEVGNIAKVKRADQYMSNRLSWNTLCINVYRP